MGEAWHADEEFWTAVAPHMFSGEVMEAAPEEAEKAVRLAGFEPGGRILDLGCGPGRHAVALARFGRVTGVDRIDALLERARARAREAGVEVEWIREDMRRFVRPAAFDLTVSLLTSFGYFEDPGDDLRVLENVHASLKPGGRFLIDLISRHHVLSAMEPVETSRGDDGSTLVKRRTVLEEGRRLRNAWTLDHDGEVRTFAFTQRVYADEDLVELLEEAGFSGIRTFRDLDGTPYAPDARRLVAVCERPH